MTNFTKNINDARTKNRHANNEWMNTARTMSDVCEQGNSETNDARTKKRCANKKFV